MEYPKAFSPPSPAAALLLLHIERLSLIAVEIDFVLTELLWRTALITKLCVNNIKDIGLN